MSQQPSPLTLFIQEVFVTPVNVLLDKTKIHLMFTSTYEHGT